MLFKWTVTFYIPNMDRKLIPQIYTTGLEASTRGWHELWTKRRVKKNTWWWPSNSWSHLYVCNMFFKILGKVYEQVYGKIRGIGTLNYWYRTTALSQRGSSIHDKTNNAWFYVVPGVMFSYKTSGQFQLSKSRMKFHVVTSIFQIQTAKQSYQICDFLIAILYVCKYMITNLWDAEYCS